MSDEKRQTDFAERLRRIEEQRGLQPSEPVTRDRPTRDYGNGVTQESHTVRNGIIWAFILAGLGAGGYYGWQAIPEDLKGAVAGLSTPSSGMSEMVSSGSIGSGGNPALAETDTMSDQGPLFASPTVAHAGPEALILGDIATDVALPTGDTLLGTIIPFARNAQCNLRDPLPSEKVVNVRIENGLLSAPLQAFSNGQLAGRILTNVEAVTQDGRNTPLDARFTGEKASVDVFLTDTSAPLYLVLQNLGPGVIWNVQTAPDVTLAHVAIVASSFSGLINPPDGATFEALLVSDFVTPHEFGGDDEIRPCMIRPWRNPQPDWIGSIKAQRNNTLYENQMYTYAKGYTAYNDWYTKTLGVDAGTNLVTARDAAHVLIGPVPAEPIPYRDMTGQDVHFMQTDHMFVGDTATRQSIMDSLHNDLLLAAVGGDVSLLNPPAIERATK